MFERIVISEEFLKYAFTKSERPYITSLANRANSLMDLIQADKCTKNDKTEYYAVKWALKQVGAINREDLSRVQMNKYSEDARVVKKKEAEEAEKERQSQEEAARVLEQTIKETEKK